MAEEAQPRSFRLAVFADFSGGAAAKPERIPVDRERFDEALARVAPQLRLRLSDPLRGGPPEDVELAFAARRDFTPVGVAEQVPLLRGLLALRQLVSRAAGGQATPDEVREAAEAIGGAGFAEALAAGGGGAEPEPEPARPAPTPPQGSGGDAVDSILDMVEGGGGTRDEARRLVDGILPRRSGPSAADRRGAHASLDVVDRALADGLDAILHDPAFRRLEESWRGLGLLVDRTDFREPIDVEIVSAGVDAAVEAIGSLATGEDVDVVVADYELDASARDLERFQALAEAGEALQTPVLTALSPAFFGLESWGGLARGRAPYAVFDEPDYAAWRSFREDERARWVVALVNRIVLRAAYGPDGERARDIEYREGSGGGLYGSPVWAVASVLTRAFARAGACVQISGTRNGLVPDLGLIEAEGGKPAPVEGVFSNERREDLERIGLAVVAPYQRDIAFVGPIRTFRKPARYPDADATADAAQHVTLSYQLFASSFVKFLGRALPELIGIGSLEEATDALRDRVVGFVSTPKYPLAPDHVGIGMSQNADDATLTDVSLRVQPELSIAGRPVNVLLNFSVRL